MVELDVYRSKDGVVIVSHDENGIRSSTAASLKKNGYCTLDEALATIAKYPGMECQIEMKQTGIAQDCYDCAVRSGIKDLVLYGSFNRNSIKDVKKIDPTARTVYIQDNADTISSVCSHPENYDDVDYLSASGISETQIRNLHLAGKKALIWTLNSQGSIDSGIKKGADGIVTDYPDRVAKSAYYYAGETEE